MSRFMPLPWAGRDASVAEIRDESGAARPKTWEVGAESPRSLPRTGAAGQEAGTGAAGQEVSTGAAGQEVSTGAAGQEAEACGGGAPRDRKFVWSRRGGAGLRGGGGRR